MILVTGGTGFIGRVLIRHLVDAGYHVRTLVRPSDESPGLPIGVPVEVVVSNINDERKLRAAMVGVNTIYHLASAEWKGTRGNLLETDIQGTTTIANVAASANVDRLIFLSHLDANRASAYPVFKAKGIVEEFIRNCGVNYTILRSSIVFGNHDVFTTGIAYLLRSIPFFIFTPGDGLNIIQPLWVEDLATVLTWACSDDSTRNQTIEVGGPEYLSLVQVIETIMNGLKIKRRIVPIRPPYLRALTVLLDYFFSRLPYSVYWLDYLAANHTCPIDSIPKRFGLMPSRFSQRIDYLLG